MRRLLYSLAVTAGLGVLLASSFAPQGPARKVVLRHGPYKVVMSKPIEGPSWNAEALYSEDRELTALFNQLEIDGLVPVFTQMVTERAPRTISQDRLVIVCRRP
jgi:hypothetical protein